MSLNRRSLLALAAAPALPAEPALRLVVAYPPGGVSDDVARALADPLAAALGRAVRVEHRPGAGGALAMEMLARAPADGSVLVFSAVTPLALLPLLGPTPYDPRRDIAPVAAVMATPVLVVGTPALAGDRFEDLIARARAQPGALRWASSGLATTGHLVLEQVCLSAGVEIVHVPYKGGGQQLNDALGGQFEVLSSHVAPATLQFARQGRLKALAVGAARPLSATVGHCQPCRTCRRWPKQATPTPSCSRSSASSRQAARRRPSWPG